MTRKVSFKTEVLNPQTDEMEKVEDLSAALVDYLTDSGSYAKAPVLCDVPNCGRPVTAGWQTRIGFRNTCDLHFKPPAHLKAALRWDDDE